MKKLYTLFVNRKRASEHAYPFFTAVEVFKLRLLREMERGNHVSLRKVKR